MNREFLVSIEGSECGLLDVFPSEHSLLELMVNNEDNTDIDIASMSLPRLEQFLDIVKKKVEEENRRAEEQREKEEKKMQKIYKQMGIK